MTSPRVKLGMESGLIGMEGLRAKRERRRNSQEVQRKRGRLNTGNVSALNAIERAAARHRVEDLKAPEIDFTQVLSADIPDKVIQDQLNLPSDFDVQALRRNPRILETLPEGSRERLSALGKDIYDKPDEEATSKVSRAKRWLTENIVRGGGVALETVGKVVDKIHEPDRWAVKARAAARDDDAEGMQLILGTLANAYDDYGPPAWIDHKLQPTLPGERGDVGQSVFEDVDRTMAFVADAFIGVGDVKKGQEYVQSRDALVESGMTPIEARNAAFDSIRTDVPGYVKFALPFIVDPLTYLGAPPLAGTVKGAGVKAARGLKTAWKAESSGATTTASVHRVLDNKSLLSQSATNNPIGRGVGSRIPGIERVFGQAARIGRLAVDDPTRLVGEAKMVFGTIQDQGESLTQLMMQTWRARGDLVTSTREPAKWRRLNPWNKNKHNALFAIDPDTMELDKDVLSWAPRRIPTEKIVEKARGLASQPLIVGKTRLFTEVKGKGFSMKRLSDETIDVTDAIGPDLPFKRHNYILKAGRKQPDYWGVSIHRLEHSDEVEFRIKRVDANGMDLLDEGGADISRSAKNIRHAIPEDVWNDFFGVALRHSEFKGVKLARGEAVGVGRKYRNRGQGRGMEYPTNKEGTEFTDEWDKRFIPDQDISEYGKYVITPSTIGGIPANSPTQKGFIIHGKDGKPIVYIEANKMTPAGRKGARGKSEWKVDVQGVDEDGTPLGFEDTRWGNQFTGTDVMEAADLVMRHLNAGSLQGWRVSGARGAARAARMARGRGPITRQAGEADDVPDIPVDDPELDFLRRQTDEDLVELGLSEEEIEQVRRMTGESDDIPGRAVDDAAEVAERDDIQVMTAEEVEKKLGRGEIEKFVGVERDFEKVFNRALEEPRFLAAEAKYAEELFPSMMKEAEAAEATYQKSRRVVFGDVFENPEAVNGLTTQQFDMIKEIQQWYKNMLAMAEAEGIKIHELGRLEDGFHSMEDWNFVARRAVGAKVNGKFVSMDDLKPNRVGRSPSQPFTKSRLHDTMEEAVQHGVMYDDPFQTMEAYSRAMYREIARVRAERQLSPILRGTGAEHLYPALFGARAMKAKELERAKTYMQRLANIDHGEVPTKSTIDAMKRWFPTLHLDIDDAMSYTGDQWSKAIDNMSRMAPELNITNEVKALLKKNIKPTKGGKRQIDLTDVARAIKEATKTRKEQSRMARDIMKWMGKDLKVQRHASLMRLHNKMDDLIPGMKSALHELSRSTNAKKALEARAKLGEAESKAFKSKVFVGEKSRWAALQMDEFIQPSQNWALSTASDLNSAVRTLKTVADFGGPLLHGLPTLFRNPEIWGKATAMHLRAFADDGVKARYVADNANDIAEFIKYGMHLGSTEMTESALKGGWLAKLPLSMEKFGHAMPGLSGHSGAARTARSIMTNTPKPVTVAAQRFSNSFEAYLDISRIEIMKGLARSAKRSKTPDKSMAEMADYANKITGVMSSQALGISSRQRQVESAMLMFSPRYTRAIASLFLEATRGGMKATEVRSSLIHLFMGQLAFHAAISAATGQNLNLMPGSDFMKNRIFHSDESPGIKVGFGGKPNTMINMIGDVTKQLIDDPESFATVNTFSAQTYDENRFLKRLRYQLSPMGQEFLNIITGADPIGRELPDFDDAFSNPLELAKYVGTRFSPFAIEAAAEAGAAISPIGGGFSFLAESAGGMTTPVGAYIMVDDLRDKYVEEDYGPNGKINKLGLESYEDLKGHHRFNTLNALMEERHDDLKNWIKKSETEQSKFTRNSERLDIQNKEDTILRETIDGIRGPDKRIQQKGWNQIAIEYDQGGRDPARAGRDFRDSFWDINARKQEGMRQIKIQHPDFFANRDKYFAETEPGNLTQAVVNEFMDFYTSSEARDAHGNLNHEAIDAKKERIIEDVMKGLQDDGMTEEQARNKADEITAQMNEDYVARYKETSDGVKIEDTVLQYIASWEVLDRYETAYKDTLPEEQWSQWQVYNASSKYLKAQLEQEQPRYRYMAMRVEKAQEMLRIRDKEIDRALIDFYDMVPMNIENKREVVQEQQRLRGQRP